MNNQTITNETKKKKASLAAAQAEKFACAHYADADFNLRRVCEALHYNYGYLSAAFRRMHGKTFCEYVNGLRLSKAANLLAATTDAVAKIAQSVGFRDALYFSKVFHRRFGVSPTAYRKQLQPPQEDEQNKADWYTRFYVK